MSAEFSSPPPPSRVQTDAAFARTVRESCQRRNWNRPALAAQAHVPLTAIHAIYRRAPVRPEVVSAVCRSLDLTLPPFCDLTPLLKVGRLLRDRRENAGLSRKALGGLAKLSDSTVKFVETGLLVPSRATCLRLLSVSALALSWSDLAPFAGSPPEPNPPTQDLPVFRPDPRLSLEMVREQMLLTEQLQRHQDGVERSPAGWRRVCWLCGSRSATTASHVEVAQGLPLRHFAACAGQLAASLLHRYPIIHELAQLERRSLLTPTARTLQLAQPRAASERSFGCRRAADLGELLACASAPPVSPYFRGVAAVLLWALDLSPCPLGLSSNPFDEATARNLLTAASEVGLTAAQPADFLRGVVHTVTWILEPHAAQPQDSASPWAQAPSSSDSSSAAR